MESKPRGGNHNPTGKGGFQPGRSGNPAGRPPAGEAFAEVLRAELGRSLRGKTNRDAIAARVVAMARAGDLDAVRWIVDRVDGKVPERLDAGVAHSFGLEDATLDAVLAYYARKRALGSGAA